MKPVFKVLAVRRNLQEVPRELLEKLTVLAQELGMELEVVRTDPSSAEEHLRQCQEVVDGVPVSGVWLADDPLPSLAMRAGFPHFVVTSDGIKKVKVHVEFEPAKPEDFDFDH